jgi:hypothetical protein
VKRFVLLLLLAVLPLQITWTAGISHCLHDRDDDVHASLPGDASHEAHAHVHDSDDGDGDHGTGSGLDCSAFHLVALVHAAVWKPSLPQAGATAHDVEYSGYKSPILDGIYRPRWRFAA